MTQKRITNQDLEILFKSKIKDKYKLALKIEVKDGLRIGEILNLQLEDLEFERNLYRLKKQKNGLLNASRYMSEYCKLEIKTYIREHKNIIQESNNYLIHSNWRKRMNNTSFCNMMQLWRIKLGINRIYMVDKSGRHLAENTSHACRSKSTIDYAKAMLKKTGYISRDNLKMHGGWQSDAMINIYLNIDDEMIKLHGDFKENISNNSSKVVKYNSNKDPLYLEVKEPGKNKIMSLNVEGIEKVGHIFPNGRVPVCSLIPSLSEPANDKGDHITYLIDLSKLNIRQTKKCVKLISNRNSYQMELKTALEDGHIPIRSKFVKEV